MLTNKPHSKKSQTNNKDINKAFNQSKLCKRTYTPRNNTILAVITIKNKGSKTKNENTK